MSLFPEFRTFLQIGPLTIEWYAVLIITGALIAYYLASKDIKKMGYDQDLIDTLFIGILGFGVLGARIWYVLFENFEVYLRNPISIFQIWNGGLAIQGGLFTGALFVFYIAKKHKINFFRLGDAILPHVLIAQAMGRWGNFFNHEAFGRIVSESYYQYFPSFIKDNMFINGAFQEPTFLYESIANIIGWALIVFVLPKVLKLKRGDRIYGYLVWYGITRFFIEGFRSDSLYFMGIRTAQAISIAFIIIGLLGFFGIFRKLFKRPKPVIAFDFDGTIMDTEKAILMTFRELFKRHRPDYEITPKDEISFVGPTLETTIPRYLEGDVQKLVEEYRAINHDLHETHVFPMARAIETLEQLKKEGYTLAVVSSKKVEAIKWGSDMHDMTKYFDVIIGSDSVDTHKPSPEGILKVCKELGVGHDQLIYVGDVVTDIQAGRNAGAYTIGYRAQGSQLGANLETGHPNRIITDLYDIVSIVREDHEWTYNLM